MKPNRNPSLTGILIPCIKNAVTETVSAEGEYVCKSILTRFCAISEGGAKIKDKTITGEAILFPYQSSEYWETYPGQILKIVEGEVCITAIGSD